MFLMGSELQIINIGLKYIHSIYFGTGFLHQLLIVILKVGSLMAAAFTSAVKSSPSGALQRSSSF